MNLGFIMGFKIEKYKLILSDLDGVVWRGEEPIRENVEAIKELKSLGLKVAFFTNNSTLTRRDYALKLSKIGVSTLEGEVVNSAYAVSRFLLENHGKSTVYPVGEAGLIEELKIGGHNIVLNPSTREFEIVEFVVVGLDKSFNYEKLRIASRLIRRGAHFIATNMDATLPVANGEDPGAGAIVEALTVASGKKPDYIVGKPNSYMVELACRMFNVEKREVLIVGDRVETDIACGFKSGIDSVLVLTGASKLEDVENSPYKPTLIVKDLSKLFKQF